MNTSSAPAKKPIAVVAQFGGETPVINRTLIGAVTELQANGYRVLGPLNGIDGILGIERDISGKEIRRRSQGRYLDFNLLTDNELMHISQMPGAHLGTSKFHVDDKSAPEIVEGVRLQDAHLLVKIGGDSTASMSMDILKAAQHAQYDLAVVHLPKTIDNDLAQTDHSPGYGSAAREVANRVFSLKTSTESQGGGLFIAVTMGRNSGYLAAASALCPFGPNTGADLIYLPEKNFSTKHFLNDVDNVLHGRKGAAVVVVSEGIREIDQKKYPDKGYKLISKIAADEFRKEMDIDPNLGQERMSQSHRDLAAYLTRLVRERFGRELRVRDDSFSYTVRSTPNASLVDALEAEAVGRQGVRFFLKENQSGSVAIRRIGQSHSYAVTFEYVPLDAVAASGVQMPDLFIDTYGKTVTDHFLEYAGPLIGPVGPYQNEFLLPSTWKPDGFIHYA